MSLKICRAEACQSLRQRGGRRALSRRPRRRLAWHDARMARSRSSQSIAWASAPTARPALLDDEPIARLDRRRLDDVIEEAAGRDDQAFTSPATSSLSRLAPTKSPTAIARGRRGARRRRQHRPQRLARHVFSRAADRGRDARRPHRLWPGRPGDVASLFDAGFLNGGAHRLRIGRPGRSSLSRAADAPHLRPLRHHRSAVARRLCRAWRLARS